MQASDDLDRMMMASLSPSGALILPLLADGLSTGAADDGVADDGAAGRALPLSLCILAANLLALLATLA